MVLLFLACVLLKVVQILLFQNPKVAGLCIVKQNNTDVVFNPDHIEAFIRLYLECPTTLNIDHFILEGMSKDFGGRPFVTEVGIKHLFSCIGGFYSHVTQLQRPKEFKDVPPKE